MGGPCAPRNVLIRRATLLTSLVCAWSCTHVSDLGHQSQQLQEAQHRPTCLVLSVGGPQGLAHLGALAALREQGIEGASVVGNSMGALVGGLYAIDPAGDTAAHFESLLSNYVAESKTEAEQNGLLLGLAGGLLAGPAGAAIGAGAGVASFEKISHRRLVSVLDAYVEGAQIESLAIPFQTSFVVARNDRIVFETVSSGSLARGIGGSLANPFIFKDIRVAGGKPLDPGIDRVSAVPIAQACEHFASHGILAINVTGERAINPCSAAEVMVAVPEASAEAILTNEDVRDAVIASGADATRQWLNTDAGRAFVAQAVVHPPASL